MYWHLHYVVCGKTDERSIDTLQRGKAGLLQKSGGTGSVAAKVINLTNWVNLYGGILLYPRFEPI